MILSFKMRDVLHNYIINIFMSHLIVSNDVIARSYRTNVETFEKETLFY